MNNSTQFLARNTGYGLAGDGYCEGWVYLPEGGYPEPLTESDPLYDVDKIRECMNRCVYAANKGLIGSRGASDTTIRDLAFYIRLDDQQCACSSGACSTRITDTAFRSYFIVNGKYEAIK